MKVVNPQAAGIDVGSRSHWVAVGQSEQDVREFGVFNEDLFAMADWLKENLPEITFAYISRSADPESRASR